MTLDEVLVLEKEQKSIKKIDLFLSQNSQTSYEYIKALSYKCLILHSLEKDKDALRYLLISTQLIPNLEKKSIVVLCDALIDIFIDIKNVEQAIKYIEIKRDNLPTIDNDKYLYDMIRYSEMVGNKIELKRYISEYLSEDISDDSRMEILEKLIKLQYIDHDYNSFDITYKKLEGYYVKNFLFDKWSALKEKRSYNLYSQHKYDELEEYIKTYISNDTSSNDLKILGAKYLLEIYLNKGETRRAMILESEYHEKYTSASLDVQLEFVLTAKKVAETIHNRFNIDEYELKEEELTNKINEEKRALRKAKKKTIDLTIVEEEPEIKETLVIKHEPVREEMFKESPTMMVEPTLIEVSSNYQSIEAILSTLSTRENVKFREIFRNFGIEIEKKFAHCEIVIALKNYEIGYHYKKERVYEKIFDDTILKGTALEELLNNSKKLYLVEVSNSLFDINPITKQKYDPKLFKTLIGFEFVRNDIKIGAITYVFDTYDFEDKLIYESLRMLSSMLQVQLNKSLDQYDEDGITRAKNFIYDNQSNGIKLESDHYIELNERAKLMLNLKNNKIDSKEYLSMIDARDASNYKMFFDDIYNHKSNEGTIYYHINGKYIKEEVFTERLSVLKIYSVLTDKTQDEEYENKLLDKIYYDEDTNIKTKSLLFNDISKIIESKKFGLAIISIKNYSMFRDIYGYDFVLDLQKIIGRVIKTFEEQNISCYHLDDDRYVVLFKDMNDLRSIKSHVSKYLSVLKENLEGFNYRLKLNLKAGIFRYTKAMRILDIKKVLSFASEGLIDAYEDDEDICVYNPESVAQRFKENQILLHVSEAIDDRSIQVNYKQVISNKDSSVSYYMARLNMQRFDIDEDYFDTVISKREITETMDRYLIKEALNEIKTFHDDTKVYYKLIIPIHRSTLTSRMFIPYLDRYLKFYKVPSSIIIFDVIDDNNKSIEIIKKALVDRDIKIATHSFDLAITANIDIYLCDVNKYDNLALRALKLSADSLNIEMVAFGITNKSRMKEVENVGIDYFVDEVDLFVLAELIKNYHN